MMQVESSIPNLMRTVEFIELLNGYCMRAKIKFGSLDKRRKSSGMVWLENDDSGLVNGYDNDGNDRLRFPFLPSSSRSFVS